MIYLVTPHSELGLGVNKGIHLKSNNLSLFLAGGMDKFDWREYLFVRLKEKESALPNLDICDPWIREDVDLTSRQLSVLAKWELDRIQASEFIFFWIISEYKQALSLLELGLVLNTEKRVILGIDKESTQKDAILNRANYYFTPGLELYNFVTDNLDIAIDKLIFNLSYFKS